MTRARLTWAVTLAWLSLACSHPPPPDPLTRLPAEANVVIGLPALPVLKQKSFELLFNIPGLDGVVDWLHFRFGLDLERDSEEARFGVSLERPIAACLARGVWVLVVPLSDPERFEEAVAARLHQNGYEAGAPGVWTRGRAAAVIRVHRQLAWMATAASDNADYLASVLEEITAGERAAPLALPADGAVALRGGWYDLMSALDPLRVFGDVPLAARSIAYGFGDLTGSLAFDQDGVRLTLRIDGGGNAGLLSTLATRAPFPLEALRGQLDYQPVVLAGARVAPERLALVLPSALRRHLSGAAVAAVGLPESPARLIRNLTQDPGSFGWSVLPWTALAARAAGSTPEDKPALDRRLPFHVRWRNSGLIGASDLAGRGEAALPEGFTVSPDTVAFAHVSFRTVYEALRETDLFPYALKVLSGPRTVDLEIELKEGTLTLRLELVI
jgi:hypothetical protein